MEPNLICQNCKGHVEINSDSYVVYMPDVNLAGIPSLQAEVKGYCQKCGAEHKYSIEGTASVESEF